MNITLTIQVGDGKPLTFRASAPGFSVGTTEEDQPRAKRPPYFIPSETSSSEPILVESPGLVRFA